MMSEKQRLIKELENILNTLKDRRNDLGRSDMARVLSVTITDLEKLIAYISAYH